MPHLSMEYSANLVGRVDFTSLCKAVHAEVLGTGLFELGAIRIRAIRCDDYAIADLMPENAFVDIKFRLGEGRSEREWKLAGEAIFTATVECLRALFETPNFALSLELQEIDPKVSWKKNSMHSRLRTAEIGTQS